MSPIGAEFLSATPPDGRFVVFQGAASDLAGCIPQHLDHVTAADLLTNLAQTYEIGPLDDTQRVIADAVSNVDALEARSNGQIRKRKDERKEGPGRLIFKRASEIEPRAVEWLWPGRIARRKLALLAGDPEQGKSQIGIDIAARLSIADLWPDDSGPAPSGSTLILSAEDAAEDTLRPRLEAAGADLRRIHILQSVVGSEGKRRTFSLQTDLDALGRKMDEVGDVALIMIDPITSYMGVKIDSYRTTDVRAVLEPVAEFAERCSAGVLGISHPPKNVQGKAINAVTGSLAFVAAARQVFLAIDDAENERKLMLAVKNNNGAKAPGLAYRFGQRIVSGGIAMSHIIWDSTPVSTTADQALANANEAIKSGDQTRRAKDFVCDILSDGPMLASDVTVRWPRLSEQIFRVDKWSLCRG